MKRSPAQANIRTDSSSDQRNLTISFIVFDEQFCLVIYKIKVFILFTPDIVIGILPLSHCGKNKF